MSRRKDELREQTINDRRQHQLAKIHIGKKWLIDAGLLTEEGYRATVEGILLDSGLPMTRKPASAADLDDQGRLDVLSTFRTLGWTETASRKFGQTRGRYRGTGLKGEAGHLTQKQADMIAYLEDRLGWTSDYTRLLGFIERQTGKRKTVEMLRNREASDLITGLERLCGDKPHPRSRARREGSRA